MAHLRRLMSRYFTDDERDLAILRQSILVQEIEIRSGGLPFEYREHVLQ